MTNDNMVVTIAIPASAEAVFDVLADPTAHVAVDGTGWVNKALDSERLSRVDQIFRVAMYNAHLPDTHYEVANKVVVFDRPRAIAWEPGKDLAGDGQLSFGGWIWRYDIRDTGPSHAEVTLTYDWSAVSAELRAQIRFPPFERAYLENSLENLAELAAVRKAG